ncbi:MAG: hypothetical protein AAGH99_05350 [Planctomycetota bacterium]
MKKTLLDFMNRNGILSVPAIFLALCIAAGYSKAINSAEGAEPAKAQLKKLISKIQSLPEETPNQRIQKAILDLAIENADKLAKEGDVKLSKNLVVDIEKSLAQGAGALREVPNRILPRVPEWDGNPYVETELNRLKKELAQPDRLVYLGARGAMQFDRKNKGNRDIAEIHNSRVFAAEIRNYAWASLHPQSPFYGDAEVLKRALRRAHAYVDAYNRVSLTVKDGTVNDFFACYSFLDGLLTLKSGAWNFVLPTQREQWLEAAENARTIWLSYIDDRGGWWNGRSMGEFGSFCNHDITKGMNIQFAGMILGDSKHKGVARRVIALQKKSLLPDGAVRYINKQNQIYGYHMVNIEKFVRHWELTGDDNAYDLLVESRNYYPLTTEPGNVAEYWTAPYWKYQWHGGAFGHGAEVVAGLTNCGYNRTIAQQNLDYGNRRNGNHLSKDIIAAPYYRSDLKPRKRLDNFIVYDRNLMSPRGRFGNFSFVGTTRDYGENPGKMSFMGCMVTDPPDREHPLNSAVKAVYPKILLDKSRPNWQGSAYLSYKEKNATCVGQNFGSLSTSYDMLTTTYGHAIKPVDWSADQQWVCLPDRIVGSVAVYPKTLTQEAYSVSGHIRLGYGLGRAHQKFMEQLSDDTYSYGNLRVKLHSHNYADTSIEESGILRDDRRFATEIILRDGNHAKNTAGKHKYSKDNPYMFTVEIYPAWSQPASDIIPLRDGDISGLTVVLEDKTIQMVHNRSNKKVNFVTPSVADDIAGNVALFSSSTADPVKPIPVLSIDEFRLSIPGHAHQVLIYSADPEDMKAGTYDFGRLIDTLGFE